MPTTVLSKSQTELVKSMYTHLNVPLDQLPYTPHFELLYQEFQEKTDRQDVRRCDLWRWLANARKAKVLPPIRKAKKAGGGNPPVDSKRPG